jgi:hypothetical protein
MKGERERAETEREVYMSYILSELYYMKMYYNALNL